MKSRREKHACFKACDGFCMNERMVTACEARKLGSE